MLRRYVEDEAVDLVYLDPPFNSNQDYNVLFGERNGRRAAAQIKAFEDTWTWDEGAARAYQETVEAGGKPSEAMQAFRRLLGENDMLAYLSMMAPRIVELRRVLKRSGSIYLHCDPTASHYLKTLMDAVFGAWSFQNEIVWQRTNARSTRGRWPRIHDTLLYYSRDPGVSPIFNPTTAPAKREKLPHTLITGDDGQKYQTYELTAPGATKEGDSGKPWRTFDPARYGRHWANSHATMDEWDAKGEIHWPDKQGGWPRRKDLEPFDPAGRTVILGDVWTDVDRLNQTAKERLGYPTQKPQALLERIIIASSNEGDLVLDPFCGCGTTIAAAQALKRDWIGIDITHLAIGLIKKRLADAYGPEIAKTYRVIGEPVSVPDAERLAAEDPYQFQWWALGLVGARPAEGKKGADKGIDGRRFFHDDRSGETKQIVFSVKAGELHATYVRDLRGVVEREKAAIGVLISFQEPTKPMRTEAASAGFYTSSWGDHPRIQLKTIAELLAGKGIDYPPTKADATFKKAPRVIYDETEQLPLSMIAEASPADKSSHRRRRR